MGIKDSALKISGSVLKKMVEKEQQKKPGCMGIYVNGYWRADY